MKRIAASAAVAVALMASSDINAHTPMDEAPDLSQFTKWVTDNEHHESFYLGQELDILDMHLHPGSYDKLGPKGKEFVKCVFPIDLPDAIKIPLLRLFSSFQLNPYGAFIGIKNECRRAAANNCILFATYAPETWGIEPNEDLLGYLDDQRNSFEDKPYFYGLASLSVENWDTEKAASLENLKNALSHPYVVGIKLAFAHTLTPFDDPKYFDVYEVAKEYDKPVYHHVGTSPLRKVSEFDEDELDFVMRTFDPVYLENAIKQYPDVKFVLGHAGNDANHEGYTKIEEVFHLAEKYDNAYIEISALGSQRHDPNGELMDSVLSRAKSAGIVHKIIYGSDGPGSPGNTKSYKDLVIESMQRVDYTFEEAQLVMAGNARDIFKIPRN
ncbi:amidohydrolase family protein [Pleionea sp. CnH1-48]|uniref:amidohydrolase family protein n=1 Tax=Pleionea sp. CnH1-48 TaxID=2954494 RepID=UPI002097E825|nr:amidohydrolase family protein [Pleionea sp. CnH1-48]MCO7225577.1 amidohydrolase family protein [Pleionea sp. CnH1-48]